MSDLERVLNEAQRARDEAEAATRRAAELEGQAEQARERARQEREGRRRAWAQGIIDSYDTDLAAADREILAAQEHFDAALVDDLPRAVKAYLDWGDAAIRHYVLQVRVGTAAPLLDMEASAAEFASPPPFSQALDQALARRLATLSAEARNRAAAEIEKTLDVTDPLID